MTGLDYSLKANRKSICRSQAPQRDQQFRYIRRIKRLFEHHQYPIISVDAKKKEPIGNFFNRGRQWCQEAQKVNAHDFLKSKAGEFKSVPYGIYEPTHNHGYVYVGVSGNTAAFAVEAIRCWRERKDRRRFGDESKLLILCDAGGSNGYRVRNWKKQLQEQLADRGYRHKAKNHPHIEPVFVNVNGRGEKSLGHDVPGSGIVPL